MNIDDMIVTLKSIYGSEWKKISEYKSYFVSKDGRVASYRNGKFKVLKSWSNGGYSTISLMEIGMGKRHKRIHRLVLEAFVGYCPKGYNADHINCIRDDNRLENLQWVPISENCALVAIRGRQAKGSKNGCSFLDEKKVAVIKQLLNRGISASQISVLADISDRTVVRIKNNIAWKHVGPKNSE
jgi:hypothetical protein